ncbi:unnamed protein product, partial [marine sediment metagenome]
ASYGIVKLKRGQRVFGINSLASFLGVKPKRIRTRLKLLENIDFLAIKRTHRFSIGTVINYNSYQDKEARKGKQKGTQRAKQGHARGTPGATNNTLEGISKELITHLNNISGRKFTHQANIDYIIPRLKDGFTKEQALTVIEKKWADSEFDRKYFCPETLFRKSKFEKYLNEDIGRQAATGSKAKQRQLRTALASQKFLERDEDG